MIKKWYQSLLELCYSYSISTTSKCLILLFFFNQGNTGKIIIFRLLKQTIESDANFVVGYGYVNKLCVHFGKINQTTQKQGNYK